MFGAELYEIALFVKQLGFVLAGGAALWGLVFSLRDFACGKRECLIHDWIAIKLFSIFLGGLVLGGVGLLASLSMLKAYAHEGIVVLPTATETIKALTVSTPFFFALILATLLILFVKYRKPQVFSRAVTPFFAISFILLFILTSLTAWGDGFRENLFFIGHGFHSIFTLGSVLVLDFLFLLSRNSFHLKQHVYPLFPKISKVVWAGLFFDFLSAYLILPEFVITQKFFFMQTVIGVLIINGVVLSGPIARKLLSTLEKRPAIGQRWRTAANVSGAISITSWMTITFVDFFKNLSIGYPTLLIGYLVIIVVIFSLHHLFEKFENNRKAPSLV